MLLPPNASAHPTFYKSRVEKPRPLQRRKALVPTGQDTRKISLSKLEEKLVLFMLYI